MIDLSKFKHHHDSKINWGWGWGVQYKDDMRTGYFYLHFRFYL